MFIDFNSPIPKYFQLQNWLQSRIEQGIYMPNEKIPTEFELVKMSGLSRATVRQAVKNLENQGYIYRKRPIGTFVRSFTNKKNDLPTIGIILPDIRAGYAPILARGAEDEATKNGFSFILCNSDDYLAQANYHADRLINHLVNGVLFVPIAASEKENKLLIEKLNKHDIPVVLVDRAIQGADTDFVTTDNFQGAFKLTEYLIQKGHEKIGILISQMFSTERLRYDGYIAALNKYNITPDPSIAILDNGSFNPTRYLEYAQKLLENKEKFTAFFAGHDRIALSFYSLSKKFNLSIPEDFSLVGYDDLPFTTISLTTMQQPIYEMGQTGMKILLSKIRGNNEKPKFIELKSTLIERSSVKRI